MKMMAENYIRHFGASHLPPEPYDTSVRADVCDTNSADINSSVNRVFRILLQGVVHVSPDDRSVLDGEIPGHLPPSASLLHVRTEESY